MRTVSLVGAALLAAMLAGCSGVPLVEHGAYAPQMKSQSVKAWGILAGHLADKTAQVAEDAHLAADDKTVFLIGDDYETQFQRGLKEMLASELVDRGFTVTPDPTKAGMVLRTSTIFVQHDKSRQQEEGTSISPLTTLGYMATFGLAFDPANRPTYTEVLLNSTVTRKGHVLMRESQTFYVQPEDAPIYKGGRR